jgi:hypothetical protein
MITRPVSAVMIGGVARPGEGSGRVLGELAAGIQGADWTAGRSASSSVSSP